MGCASSRVDVERRSRIVTVTEGSLEGFQLRTQSGIDCDVFLGIPYAKPPVGELRFQKPQPLEPSKEVRKCDKYPNRSIHKESFWDKFRRRAKISEDCLYLNVHAPEIEKSNSYPVLFFIHGGGFLMGSAEDYQANKICQHLVARDIIVVTCHYRLGYLGFLSTADDRCPGNFALWDMLVALKWTHHNIAKFGGDPDNITISGHSAGAVSADLLSLSPLSAGLFKGKILMGGNSYCHWAIQKIEDVKEHCRQKALELGWKPGEQELLEFYKQIPAERLGTTMLPSKSISTECHFPLAPVIDGDFFPDSIDNLRQLQTPVPCIVGGGEYEILFFYALYLMRGNDKELENVIRTLVRKTGMSKAMVMDIIEKVYEEKDRNFFVNLTSDIFVNYSIFKFIKSQKDSQCYAYSFDEQSKQLWGWLRFVVPFTGGTHTSDLNYLFDCNFMMSLFGANKADKLICQMTGEFITNFVTFGNPNSPLTRPTWEPVDDRLRLFSIKSTPEMKKAAHIERMRTLDNIMKDQNRQ